MRIKIFKIVFALAVAITGAFNYATFAQCPSPDPKVWKSDGIRAWNCSDYRRIGVGAGQLSADFPSAQFHIFRGLFAEDGDFFLVQKQFGSSLNTLFAIKEDGKTGVGTYTPSSTLSVFGDFDVDFSTLYAGTSGKVGIGTRNPQKALHIYTLHQDCGPPFPPCTHQGLRLENEESIAGFHDISVWDVEPVIDRGVDVTSKSNFAITQIIGLSSKRLFTLTEDGNIILSGRTVIGGNPFSIPQAELDVNGDAFIDGFLRIGSTAGARTILDIVSLVY